MFGLDMLAARFQAMIHGGLQTGLVAMAACCNTGLHAFVIGSKHKHGSLLFEKSFIVSDFAMAKYSYRVTVRLCPGEFCTLTDIFLLFEKGNQDWVLSFTGFACRSLLRRKELHVSDWG
jgi:hypothetical protein